MVLNSQVRSEAGRLTIEHFEQAPPAPLLLVAAWFGLLAGLAEVSVMGTRKLIFHQTIDQSVHFVWMTPVADLLFFVILGFILLVVSRWWPRLASPRIATFAFGFLAFFSLFFLFHPQLNKLVGMLLALGFAVQTSRFAAARNCGFHLLVRRTITGMSGVVLVLAVGVFGWQWLTEHRTLSNLPSVGSNSPNVLLIVLDTVSAQNLSLYGYARPTAPRLEQFAKTGVRFERALSTAPWTLPSHASMFTGRYPYELSTNWQTPLDANHPTLAESLSERGYLTAAFVANTRYASYEHGIDRGFARYEDYALSFGQLVKSSSLGRYLTNSPRIRKIVNNHQDLARKTASDVNVGFLSWLSSKGERPFFVFLNYYDAHVPYVPPQPFELRFGPTQPWQPLTRKEEVSAEEIQARINGYDGSIAYLDHQLGLLLEELEKRGVLQKTLVIITSDHGEEFGEHGIFGHGDSLYMPAVHVPLLISFPSRVPVGGNVREAVTLRDLPATVMELLDLEERVRFPGNSLVRYWNNTGSADNLTNDLLMSEVKQGINVAPWLPNSKGDMKSLVSGTYHYIKNGDGSEELYNFKEDQNETNNLSRAEEERDVLERFRAALKAIS